MVKNNTKFKETELGPIPEEWEVLPIYELAEWINGLAFKDIHFTRDGRPVIKINELKYGITEQTQFTQDVFDEDYHLRNKDLLFSWSGSPETSIDAFWYSLPDGWLNQHIFKVKPRSAVTNEFLFYLLKANKPRLIDIARDKQTTGLGHVTVGDLKRFDVALPSLAEQKSISSILSSLDDKIELNRQINANLEKIASALFKRWFVDFEFPDKNGKPYKSSGGKMVESEMGEIPEGWRVEKLSDVADITIGRTPPRMEEEWFSTNPKDKKWISIRDMGNVGVYINQTAEYLTQEAVDRFNIPVIPKNTVVVSFKLTVGRIAITADEMLSNEAIAHIKLRGSAMTTEYIYGYLKRFDFASLSSTSSIATAVNSKSIKEIQILIPTEEVILRYSKLVEPMFKAILAGELQGNELKITRDLLLPRLMSGKIRLN